MRAAASRKQQQAMDEDTSHYSDAPALALQQHEDNRDWANVRSESTEYLPF
jgi:uncharacterized protein YqfB (UPF0267 family)